ncbi:ATP-dependent DNA helicase [Trichonephila clavata]|uniref:ATP-dependent DNA helicase n=1 Tax=Trichonephila clavata TaxID=2740835 RepID=A0A8X6KU42_TRICU|nr:ATP-dependent DNA helicase [Trichonephila clavata]
MQEVETKCPYGIQLFNTNEVVTRYNNKMLSLTQEKVTSIAKDKFIGCTSAEQTTYFLWKLHKMSLIDSEELPYEIAIVQDIYYRITTRIDVPDGLKSGAVGKLVYIDYNVDRDAKGVWLEFPDSQKIGQKIKKTVDGHGAAIQISKTAVPIGRRSSNIPLNNDKTINF